MPQTPEQKESTNKILLDFRSNQVSKNLSLFLPDVLIPIVQEYVNSYDAYIPLIQDYNEIADEQNLRKAQTFTEETDPDEIAREVLLAIERGYIKTLHYLLATKKVNANEIIRYKCDTPWHEWYETTMLNHALKYRVMGIILFLLENYNLNKKIMNEFTRRSISWDSHSLGNPLTIAIDQGNCEMTALLLKYGADPDYPRPCLSWSKYPALLYVALHQQDDRRPKKLSDAKIRKLIQIIFPFSKFKIDQIIYSDNQDEILKGNLSSDERIWLPLEFKKIIEKFLLNLDKKPPMLSKNYLSIFYDRVLVPTDESIKTQCSCQCAIL